MVRLPFNASKLQAGAVPLNFSDISFLKCSQFCVHEPDLVIRAGLLGAVTAQYPASLPLSLASQVRDGGTPTPPAKQNVTC